MGKVLMILEVAHKQEYIFASRRLRENAARSGDIAFLTSSAFFQWAADDLYHDGENLVYSGGGHAVLQFDGKEQADAFAGRVTETVLRQFPGMALYVKQIPYDSSVPPQDNLQRLHTALEAKKAIRKADFRQMSFGVELPGELIADGGTRRRAPQNRTGVVPPEGWEFSAGFGDLAGEDNFIAVIHIDGNGMGRRVDGVYRSACGDWERCRGSLRRFSESVQSDFEAAFREMADMVADEMEAKHARPEHKLPLRPVILAGDDVCFVTAGAIGLECARIFLERLARKVNLEDGKPYAACAGVALVHRKYPFHRAYDLAEELCSNAKKYGARLDKDGWVSAMDWHIEFGQMKDGLSELRRDYITEDGGLMTLRPVTVLAPDGESAIDVRSYGFFRELCLMVKERRFARSKIKDLRRALKQGELESRFFLISNEMQDLLFLPREVENRFKGLELSFSDKVVFQRFEDVNRCLFFDAIEMADHFEALGGEST